MQAQQIQSRLAMTSANKSLEQDAPRINAVQTNPMLDLVQMTHDRLYSRLFQS